MKQEPCRLWFVSFLITLSCLSCRQIPRAHADEIITKRGEQAGARTAREIMIMKMKKENLYGHKTYVLKRPNLHYSKD